MTFDEFMAKVLEAFPEAMVGEDNDGQLVIYTNLREVPVTDLTGEQTDDTVVIAFEAE